MRKVLKHYFIPHEGNNYHPHILHTKRVFLYGGVGIVIKLVVVLFVIALPLSAYMAPDVLKRQAETLVALVNQLREQKGETVYRVDPQLTSSSQGKAQDMATYQYFSHTSPSGKTLVAWMNEVGYHYQFVGENLAIGFSSPADIVQAWKESPKHYSNLIDTDFHDVGIGLKAADYEGVQTEFIVMHFGAPRAMLHTETTSTPFTYDAKRSRVYWQEDKNGTALSATAHISGGPVQSARIFVRTVPIELKNQGNDFYAGSVVIPQSPDELFKTVVTPTISLIGLNGEKVDDQIEWNSMKVVPPPPLKKYSYAKNIQGPAAHLFSWSSVMYRGLILFFAAALFLCIVIEYRKQHLLVIVQTLVLIGFFVLLLNT